MIKRVWQAWTTPDHADAYEALLRNEIFVAIRSRNIEGFRSVELLRRPTGAETEFMVIMAFDSLESVKALVGETYEVAYVPDKARALLSRFDERARHFEVAIGAD